MKHRLVTPPAKIKPPPTPPQFDGLRIVLANASTGGLTAITRNGLEVPIELSLAGLNKLHEMLIEQQRKKTVPPIGVTPTLILAEWTRLGPTGAGKVRKTDLPSIRYAATGASARKTYRLEDLLP